MLSATWNLNGLAVFDLGPRRTLLTWGGGPTITTVDGWPAAARAALRPGPGAPPFEGGLVGWLGYEAGAAVERMPPPRAAPPVPALCLWRAEGALLLEEGRWRIVGSPAFRAEAEALLARAEAHPVAPSPLVPGPASDGPPGARERYVAAVGEVLAAIRRGDVYQVNIAWEQAGIPVSDPLGVWLALRAANPARRGALLRRDGITVLSNSPELYLRVRRRGERLVAHSVPIKGTADARGGAAARAALRDSEKEQAELTMITDLVRNDLGRVAAAGGVLAGPRRVVRAGDLWHAEQGVRARLRRSADAIDAIAASFPPGSVTGAPKVEAMKLIHALEPGPRGIYTGAIGLLADSGEAHFNVAIRTATIVDGLARFHVGAGLVADSDPATEWEETVAKARALSRWLGARPAGGEDPERQAG